jgi:hypothetical protein
MQIEKMAYATVSGYFTLCNYIQMQTPEQLEMSLGLKAGHLATGARLYKFARLPQMSEYEYDLTAKYPGGLSVESQYGDEIWPEGSNKIHQWRLNKGVTVRVEAPIDIVPGQVFRIPNSWNRKSASKSN